MRRVSRLGRLLAPSLALLLLAPPGRAVAGASILEPKPLGERRPITGVHFGFWASSSQPGSYATSALDPGIKGGMALTWIRGRSAGFGVAVDYCRWRSAAAGADLDELFSAFSGTEIRGTEVTMSGLRGTMRFTESLETRAPVAPWVQIGGGICRLRRKTVVPVQQLIDSGWEVKGSGGTTVSYEPILLGGVGLDLKVSPSTRVGFDVMGEMLFIGGETDELVTSFTIGGHVLFGRWSGQ